jgi:hypothetical protein
MISFWMCKNAVYPNGITHEYIWCAKGHDLGAIRPDMAQRGKPLLCRACNPCPDCDIMGAEIQKSERGWE